MPVIIGEVTTFANPKADKAQALKIAEECMEVYSAWEDRRKCIEQCKSPCEEWLCYINCRYRQKIVDECADVITATCNLLAALGVDDMREAMKACEQRNRERGRL